VRGGSSRRGWRALGVVADVTSQTSVEEAVSQTTDALVRTTCWSTTPSSLTSRACRHAPRALARQLAVILDGTFRKGRPQMVEPARRRDRHHHLDRGHQGQPRNVGYCTAKAGLLNHALGRNGA
jgi:hypothetical protein